jgi:hypothetical protein
MQKEQGSSLFTKLCGSLSPEFLTKLLYMKNQEGSILRDLPEADKVTLLKIILEKPAVSLLSGYDLLLSLPSQDRKKDLSFFRHFNLQDVQHWCLETLTSGMVMRHPFVLQIRYGFVSFSKSTI